MLLLLLTLALGCRFDKADDSAAIDPPIGDDTAADDTGDTPPPVTRQGCDASHDAFIAALQADLDASDAPGVSAAIMEDGLVSCRVTLGTIAADSDEAPSIDTLFQIGSTTKMFTATALLQKVEDGELSLDDTLAQAYPDSEFDLDETWNDQVLLQHLLTHQGAFYDYVDETRSSDDEDLVGFHEEVFFPYLWLMAPPGSFWNYANPNFDVAGLVVEAHDSRYYPDIMLQDVFGPLGMTRTMQRKTEVEADGDYALGVGYTLTSTTTADYGPVPIEDVPDPAHGRPAGVSTWTTPDQLLSMARFLVQGDSAVLSDDLREAMTTAWVSLGYGEAYGSYGYGVFVGPGFHGPDLNWYEVPIWQHGGNTNSYSSSFTILPEADFAVSILSSGFGTDFSMSAATAIVSLVDLPDPTDAPELDWDPDRLDLHVGTYTDAYNVGEVDITRDGDTLRVQMPDLAALGYTITEEMQPVSSDLWYVQINGDWYDVLFVGGEGDTPSQYLRNRYYVGIRDEERAVRAHPSALAAARWLRQARSPRVPMMGPRPPESAGSR